MKLINLVLTTAATAAKLSPQEKQSRNLIFYEKHCVGSPSARVDCGYPGISATQCAKKKCCWDESVPGVAFCYQSAVWSKNWERKDLWFQPLPKACPSDSRKRDNCGFSRITPDQCVALGCCFDDQVKNVPWCFHKNEVLPKQRSTIVKTVHRTKSTLCSKLPGVGMLGVDFECTDGFRDASVCTLKCSNGISEGGKSFVSTCIAGKWEGDDTPDCNVVMAMPSFSKYSRTYAGNMGRLLMIRNQRLITGGRCNAPAPPMNGFRSCKQSREPGREYQYFCTFECEEGYQQIGTSVRSCPTAYGNSNRWSGTPFQCVPIDTSPAARSEDNFCFGVAPSDANIEVRCEPGHVYGELKCTYSCTDATQRMMRGPPVVTCRLDQWKEPPVRPVCVSGFCNALGDLENGSYQCTDNELDGSTCDYECNSGFRLIGESSTTCSGNEWSGTMPRCVPDSIFAEGTCSASDEGHRVRRMIGGADTETRDFQIAIYYDRQFKCGGTLISSNWVLTAAHCIRGDISKFQVYSNAKNAYFSTLASATSLGVEKLILHENYVGRAQWDIGLIKTSISESVTKALCLPKPDYHPPSSNVELFGYGSVSNQKNIFPQSLKRGSMSYFSASNCGYIKQRFDADNLFCAKGSASACQGDSGGPVTYQDKDGRSFILGITSSGRCGSDQKPGLYVRVAKFIPWIHQHLLA